MIYATGWERNFSCTSNSGLTIIKVPYSEHCSYGELRSFLQLIRPRAIESIINEKDTHECREILSLGHGNIAQWNALQKKININKVDVMEQQTLLNRCEKKRQIMESAPIISIASSSDSSVISI